MIIRIDDIKATPQEIEYLEKPDGLNELLDCGEPREYRFPEVLRVRLTYYRSGLDLFFSGSLAATAVGTCCRCLEDYTFDEQKGFSLVLSPRKQVAGEIELKVEELKESEYQGPEVDLTPLIYEQAILGLPTKPLCRVDCRGLCPVCGRNKNLAECGCRQENLDPRLAVLRSLKVGRS